MNHFSGRYYTMGLRLKCLTAFAFAFVLISGTQAQQDFSKVQIKATHIAGTVRIRLNQGGTVAGQDVKPSPKEALPVITFKDGASIHVNGEEIRAVHMPHGHTDGDSLIFFSEAKVVHMGDDFVTYGFPFVD